MRGVVSTIPFLHHDLPCSNIPRPTLQRWSENRRWALYLLMHPCGGKCVARSWPGEDQGGFHPLLRYVSNHLFLKKIQQGVTTNAMTDRSFPCLTCSVKITQVGISEVVYSQGYSIDQAVRRSTLTSNI